MGLLKKSILYGLALSLLASCSLFSSTPPSVLEGQRGIYQGITLIEENVRTILNTYEEDTKAAIIYHVNFVYEQQIQEVKESVSMDDQQKEDAVTELKIARDSELKEAFEKIQHRHLAMKDRVMFNLAITKKLSETVYSYFSTTPISVENVGFIIQNMVIQNGRNQN